MLTVIKGHRIEYRLAAGVELAKATVRATGAGTWLGDLGNADHQWEDGDPRRDRRTGDHTAWPADGPAGVVKAFDWEPDDLDRFEAWWLAQLRAGRYAADVKFSNLAGRQYGPRGGFQRRSSDQHLHVSFKPGAVNRRVDIIADYLADQEEDMDQAQKDQLAQVVAHVEDVRAMLLDGTSPTGNPTTGGKPRVVLFRELADLKAAAAADAVRDAATQVVLDKILAATGGTADLDTAAVVAAVRAEAEKTRGAILAAAAADLQHLADALSSASG